MPLLRMKCHIKFDPGGRMKLHVPIVFILCLLQFSVSEVECSSGSAADSEERWQRRQEFPETNLGTDLDQQLKANEIPRHSEKQAINSLSVLVNPLRKLHVPTKSLTKELAADVPLLKSQVVENQTSKNDHVGDGEKGLTFRGRDSELDPSVENKPSSVLKVDLREGETLSWSHESTGSILNDKTGEHRHLKVKRQISDETENAAGSANEDMVTEKLPTPISQGESIVSSSDAPSVRDRQTGGGTLTESSSKTSAAAHTTTQTTEPSSIRTASTVQKDSTAHPPKTSSATPPTVHLQQPPKITSPEKEASEADTSPLVVTEESQVTDALAEESNASCEGAQCYASRLPYHWTSDASWALASMVFLLSVLTFFVLYTGLWKKRNPMSFPLDSSVPPNPNPKITIAELLKTRLALIPKHLRNKRKRQMHRKRMNGRRYEELPLHLSNGTCNDEELGYFEDDEEEDLYLQGGHTV
ncbi:uncharacterized protein LOC121408622 isoform X2 [Lytechinus variegatus]|uniref:uncharacterized protein LOC121408622 isoform X2 n=1 Tax=Lytechinus variegatus TaxID=7654 RepID=UPI001BB24AC8|nr:uncharacterized protein LOC121408622 isoform X2 [Lytechinus variegatus]